MALIHDATLTPGKLEFLNAWVPGRPWSAGTTAVEKIATYRFDDPAGEVGTETFVLRADDGTLLQVPLTYRGAPLEGAEPFLITTLEHSVLGTRWVYDGCGDPVWVTAAVTAILTGGRQAPLLTEQGEEFPSSATVSGSGSPGTDVEPINGVHPQDGDETTRIQAGPYELVVARVVGADLPAGRTLAGAWDGGIATLLALA